MHITTTVCKKPTIPLGIDKNGYQVESERQVIEAELASLEAACTPIYRSLVEMGRPSEYLAAHSPLFTNLRDCWQRLIQNRLEAAVCRFARVRNNPYLNAALARILVNDWIKTEIVCAQRANNRSGNATMLVVRLEDYERQLLSAISAEMVKQGIWHSVSTDQEALVIIL